MNDHAFAKSLKGGNTVYGTLIVSTSPRWLSVANTLGLDYVFIDTEHIAIDRERLSWMCQAYSGIGLPALVRITAPDPYQATAILDGGAAGVVAPYIETVEQVQQLVGAVKARPIKGDRLQRYLSSEQDFETDLKDYIDHECDDNVLIVNIESMPAIENLDGILKVEGLDGVLVGPHDLSCSLGIPEQYDHPRFVEAVDTIITQTRAAGKSAGIHIIFPDGLEQEIRWAKLGANLILHGADIIAFKQTMSHDLQHIKNALGQSANKDQTTINI